MHNKLLSNFGIIFNQISLKLESGGALLEHLTARSLVKCMFSTLFSTEAQNVKFFIEFWDHFWNQISLKLESGAAQVCVCEHVFEGVKKVLRIEI